MSYVLGQTSSILLPTVFSLPLSLPLPDFLPPPHWLLIILITILSYKAIQLISVSFTGSMCICVSVSYLKSLPLPHFTNLSLCHILDNDFYLILL